MSSSKRQINQICDQLYRRYGIETAVVFVDHLSTYDIRTEALHDFFTDLFNYWGVGDPATNNGLVIGMSMQHRRLEIVTGYGMERVLSNRWLKNMQEDYMVPQFKRGDFGRGIAIGLDHIEMEIQ